MSAVVTIPDPSNGINDHRAVDVEAPKANAYDIDSHTGYLRLYTSAYGQPAGVFKEWHYVVITPNRGSDGRFVKRGQE